MRKAYGIFIALVFLSGCALLDDIGPRVFPGSTAAQAKKEKDAREGASLELFTLEDPETWAQTPSGVTLQQGGFSGLVFIGKTSEGEYQFMSHTDRGPNSNPVNIEGVGKDVRPFVVPDLQPRWLLLETNRQNNTFQVVKQIRLTNPRGKPLTGVGNYYSATDKNSDERPVDMAGKLLPLDVNGIDPEGLTKDADGNFWMCEEYRPSLLKFSPDGKLIKRFIPKNGLPSTEIAKINQEWGRGHLVSNLPEEYRLRSSNRGFEGITFQNGKIYATLQSSLDIPGALHKKVARIVVFDVKTETVTGEMFYPLYRDGVDKMGDLSALPETPGLFAIEQNSKAGREGQHLVTRFTLNVQPLGQRPELKAFEALKDGKQLLSLETVSSLAEQGYDFAEKVEGLAMISNHELAVINDNDFGVAGDIDFTKQTIPITTKRLSVLGILKTNRNLGETATKPSAEIDSK